jgi:protein-tyrosine phosphatase
MNQLILTQTNGYMTQILDHLYLGDIETSKQANNIQYILNLSNDKNYKEINGIKYLHIPIDDNRSQNISQYFEQSIQFIEEAIQQQKNILVHCMNGVSRSVSIILAYMLYKGYTLKDAFLFVKNKREYQYTRPNIGFFKQLCIYEYTLYKSNSISLAEYI